MIDGVSQVSMNVSVNDLERSKKFWIETVGFELVSDQEMGNERWIRVTPPDHNVVLVLGGPNPFLAEFQRNLPTQLPNSTVFFACDDIVMTHKETSRARSAIRANPDQNALRLVGVVLRS